MLKRPTIRDDDDEILRQQAEYFKQKAEKKVTPAATVIKSSKTNASISSFPKPLINNPLESNYEEKMDIDPHEDASTENIQNQIANTFEAIPTDMKLNQVTERRAEMKDIKMLHFDSGGFPKAVRRNADIKPKSGSIFSQHIKRLKKDLDDSSPKDFTAKTNNIPLVIRERNLDGNVKESPVQSTSSNLGTIATTSQKSGALTASDRQLIHKENMKKLNAMAEDEILAEREKLISTLDPALVQFLRSQRSNNKETLENRNPTIKEQNEAADTVIIEQLKVPKEMLSMPEATGWLHFNKFEANKLAWMKDVPVTDLKKNKGFEARFDFDGYLLPYCLAQIDDSNRLLYHHGDEPERPGYTLQELLLLSRSNVIQQRIIALNTLGNILCLNQTGIYDKVIDVPIEQVFFVLRVCLDDNTPSVLTAAIKALRNLVYFQLDETCLDNMISFGIGTIQPILAVDNDLEDDNTINDQQLAETNIVKCLARTEILTRIRYIINTIKPSSETVIYCIEVLTRLARDSEFIIDKILKCEGLLSSLIKYFIPIPKVIGLDKANPGYNMPLPQMVKLLRILSSRSRNIAASLLKKYDLFDNLVSYLHEDHFSQNAFGMRLQVECMYYWTLLLHYGLVTDSANQHSNLLLKFLDYHFKNTDNFLSTTLIRQSHASALLILLAKTVEKGFNLFPDLIKDCFGKWINQFKALEQFRCGHSQITSAMFYFAATRNRCSTGIYSADLLESVLDSDGFNLATCNIMFMKIIEESIEPSKAVLWEGQSFGKKHIYNVKQRRKVQDFKSLSLYRNPIKNTSVNGRKNGSLLLNNYETHKTSANLKSLEAATWHSMDHIVPVMQTNSCIPFLYALSSCVLSDSSSKVKRRFLSHVHIKAYTEKLKTAKHYFNVGNWFTRCESFLIMNVLKMAQSVQDDIDSTLYYDVAVKGLCLFSAEQKQDMKYLLDHIVFCPRFYSVEVAMANTRVSERNDELNQAWRHLDDIKRVYTDVLGISSNLVTFETTLTLDMNIGNVIPVDWIYTPLVLLYSNQQKRSKVDVKDEWTDLHIILNCLRWILIYESYFESLAGSISPTEKYVRLGCLFLGSDSLFLHTELQGLLTRIYQFLVKTEKKIDFEQEISGLTNFKDFFVQLLEQYQAVSYGNKIFGNVLLFALMKRHDIKYRKTLWSEYMGVVETFTVSSQEVWINTNDLINPIDTDTSLHNCYLKALATNAVPRNTMLYEVALVNVRHFKGQSERETSEGMTNG